MEKKVLCMDIKTFFGIKINLSFDSMVLSADKLNTGTNSELKLDFDLLGSMGAQ